MQPHQHGGGGGGGAVSVYAQAQAHIQGLRRCWQRVKGGYVVVQVCTSILSISMHLVTDHPHPHSLTHSHTHTHTLLRPPPSFPRARPPHLGPPLLPDEVLVHYFLFLLDAQTAHTNLGVCLPRVCVVYLCACFHKCVEVPGGGVAGRERERVSKYVCVCVCVCLYGYVCMYECM